MPLAIDENWPEAGVLVYLGKGSKYRPLIFNHAFVANDGSGYTTV